MTKKKKDDILNKKNEVLIYSFTGQGLFFILFYWFIFEILEMDQTVWKGKFGMKSVIEVIYLQYV